MPTLGLSTGSLGYSLIPNKAHPTPKVSRRRCRTWDLVPSFKCSSQTFPWKKRSVRLADRSTKKRDGEAARPQPQRWGAEQALAWSWASPDSRCSKELDLFQVCSSAPGLGNSPHLGRPAGLQGVPNTHKLSEQAGKHRRTHSQWAVCQSHVWPLWQSCGQELSLDRNSSKVSKDRVTNPRRATETHLVTLVFSDPVPPHTAWAQLDRLHPVCPSAQSKPYCPRRKCHILPKPMWTATLALLPTSGLMTRLSHLNICTWLPTVPLP